VRDRALYVFLGYSNQVLIEWQMRFVYCFCISLSLIFPGCSNQPSADDRLYQLVSSDHSRITFENSIQDNDSLNILTYEYLYNGGGVGVLDVNNDGLNDLFFTGNQVPNALYLNKGNFQFEDISASAKNSASEFVVYGCFHYDSWFKPHRTV
jgi:enediyne biosynthesis protein E4